MTDDDDDDGSGADDVAIVHVQRPPLPWRETTRTECGLPPAGHPVISREEFLQKLKRLGQQRTAMTTCMTCYNTASRHPTWDENPVQCVAREITWHGSTRKTFARELRAIAALVSRHREEFDELIEDQKEIVPLRSMTKVPR